MAALVTQWLDPPPALVTAWIGPDGRIDTVLEARRDPDALPVVFGPRGRKGDKGDTGAPGEVPDPGDLILYFQNGLT